MSRGAIQQFTPWLSNTSQIRFAVSWSFDEWLMNACFVKPDVVADGEPVGFDSGLALPSFRIFSPAPLSGLAALALDVGFGDTIFVKTGGGGFSDAAASFGAGTIIAMPQVGQVTCIPTQSFSTSICWLQLEQANFMEVLNGNWACGLLAR